MKSNLIYKNYRLRTLNHLFLFCDMAICFCLFMLPVQAQNNARTQTERTDKGVKEIHVNNSNYELYVYSIDSISEKVDQEKALNPSLLPDGQLYPNWMNRSVFNADVLNFKEYLITCFSTKKENVNYNTDHRLISCKILINNEGECQLYEITSQFPLFDFYSATEIKKLFEEVSTFRFSSPIMKSPSKGYIGWSIPLRWPKE